MRQGRIVGDAQLKIVGEEVPADHRAQLQLEQLWFVLCACGAGRQPRRRQPNCQRNN